MHTSRIHPRRPRSGGLGRRISRPFAQDGRRQAAPPPKPEPVTVTVVAVGLLAAMQTALVSVSRIPLSKWIPCRELVASANSVTVLLVTVMLRAAAPSPA